MAGIEIVDQTHKNSSTALEFVSDVLVELEKALPVLGVGDAYENVEISVQSIPTITATLRYEDGSIRGWMGVTQLNPAKRKITPQRFARQIALSYKAITSPRDAEFYRNYPYPPYDAAYVAVQYRKGYIVPSYYMSTDRLQNIWGAAEAKAKYGEDFPDVETYLRWHANRIRPLDEFANPRLIASIRKTIAWMDKKEKREAKQREREAKELAKTLAIKKAGRMIDLKSRRKRTTIKIRASRRVISDD